MALDGARNFRDLGGYDAQDGRRVRSGLLYRSDQLHALSERDLMVLDRLGIRLVCDLRTAGERDQRPSRLPPRPELRTAHLPIQPTADSELARRLRDGELAGYRPAAGEPEPDTTAMMEGFYRSFIVDHQAQWCRLFDLLTGDESHPAVIHCAGGKDRTGVACALIHSALGVPRQTILEDYQLTNRIVGAWLAELPDGDPPGFIERIVWARRRFLMAAFAAIDQAYGSMDGYLQDGLGMTDQRLESFRRRLLV